MSLTVQLTQDQFQEIATDVVGRIVQEAMLVMQRKIQAAGFVLTADLLNSLQYQSVVIARDLYAEFSIGFRGYGRFKDMRRLVFTKMPPIEAMEEFVRQVGVEKFQYVPGYLTDAKRRTVVSDSRAINRIAWGVAVHRLQRGSVATSRNKAFYNPTRGHLIYDTSYKMMQALPQPILKALKDRLEGA